MYGKLIKSLLMNQTTKLMILLWEKYQQILIRARRFGEQTGILSTEKFSGFGKKHNDPTYRLKLLARIHKYTDINNKKHKKIEGGMIPLLYQ